MSTYLLPRGTEITDPQTGRLFVTPCDCRPKAVEFDVDGEYDDGRMIYRGHAVITLKHRVVHADFKDVKESR